jgi:hypothetical protein
MPAGDGARRDRIRLIAAGSVLAAACIGLGRADTLHTRIPEFLALYGVAFAAYLAGVRVAWRSRHPDRVLVFVMLAAAVLARAAVVPARPDLSTDIYRYLWEGRMVAHGINPFALAPADTSLVALRDADFPLINHGHLVTIYPPFAQAVFAAASRLHPGAPTLKAVFTFFDLATVGVLMAMLRRRRRPAVHALAYGWSPLVIVETGHSGHLDAMGAFFLVVAVALFAGRGRWAGAVSLGLSVLVKYLGVVLVPFMAARRRWGVVAVVAVVVIVGYLPFLGAGTRLVGSLREYGATWWFNGPPYMALAAVIHDPALARRLLVAFGVVFALVTAFRETDPARYACRVVACALLLSPTVYPWYLVWIVPFLCLFPSRGWFAFTGLVALSYIVWPAYAASGAWTLPNWVLALEYLPVYGLLAWDAWRSAGGESGAF